MAARSRCPSASLPNGSPAIGGVGNGLAEGIDLEDPVGTLVVVSELRDAAPQLMRRPFAEAPVLEDQLKPASTGVEIEHACDRLEKHPHDGLGTLRLRRAHTPRLTIWPELARSPTVHAPVHARDAHPRQSRHV